MLESSPKPVCAERTPEACDFADRLGLLAKDALVIELAVNGGLEVKDCTDRDGAEAIVLALRRLRAELELLADSVLPEMTDGERALVARATGARLTYSGGAK